MPYACKTRERAPRSPPLHWGSAAPSAVVSTTHHACGACPLAANTTLAKMARHCYGRERWGLAHAKSHQQAILVDTPRCQASRRPALPSVERLLPPRRAHIKLHTHRNEHVTHARLLVETESRAHALALATSGPCFGCPMPTSTVSAHGTGGASHCWPTATSSSELDPRLRHPPSLWLLTVPTVALSAALTQTSPP